MNPKAVDVKKIIESSGDAFTEFHLELTNISDAPVLLEHIELFSCDELTALGLAPGDYTVFRSGRHKNDMPGVFVTGCIDERLSDVCSGMTESGDKEQKDSGSLTKEYKISSDHMTLIGDSKGKAFAIEFLTGRDQLFETAIYLDANAQPERIVSEVVFNCYLMPGETARTESLRTALVDDPGKETALFAERKAMTYGCRNSRRPAVFCTWYFYELNVTYEDVMTNLRIIKDRHLPYDVFQIDEGWEVTLGEYVPNHKFPVSMKQLAEEISEAGMIPGIWSSPFVAHETATIWKKHPEWILKDRKGSPCLFPMNDTVYYVFDITNKETWQYFKELYHMFTYEWGYQYHKLDFTRAAVIYEDADFCDKTITLAAAYYRAVKAIREGMGEESFFLMCGGLYDPIIGLVDAQRTGSDVLSMWSSIINKNGKTTPYTIRQSVMRYYMNYWWANDPDALMIRENPDMQRQSRLTLGLLTDEEVKVSVMNQFTGGGIMCQTEPLDQISDERLLEIRHILPVINTKTAPLDIMCTDRFPGAVRVDVEGTDICCICITNWSDIEDKELSIDLSCLGLDNQYKYAVSGFYSGIYRTDLGSDGIVNLGMITPHSSEVVKIEKMADSPVIVASDYHYSMGGECITRHIAGDSMVIEVQNLLPVDIHYTILLPEGYEFDGNRTVELTIEKEDPNIARLEVEVELENRGIHNFT